MKIAVTFFRKKRERRIYNKILQKNKYVNIINPRVINIKKYQILLLLFVGVLVAINSNNIIYFSSNISKINGIKITKEDIIALNGIANRKNYTFKEVEEKKEEPQPDEFIAMDEIANQYTDQMVFKNLSNNEVKIITENSNFQKLNVCGIDITNYSTNRNINFQEILNLDDIYFNKSVDDMLLYTTHTSESYANSEGYSFEYTSPRRTTDGNYNMLSISTTLASNLNNKGINTICSLTPHDYGEYNSAYGNSRKTIQALMQEHNNIKMCVDVHRDAIEDLDFAPKVNLKGYDVASVMLVMGIGYEGEENPNYKQNLKLAIQIQMLANKIYPGLFRPMIIRNSIYNQDMMPNSFLIEVGASGNTIKEAKIATRCLANLLNILYKD